MGFEISFPSYYEQAAAVWRSRVKVRTIPMLSSY